MLGKLSKTLRGSHCDLPGELGHGSGSSQRSQSVINMKTRFSGDSGRPSSGAHHSGKRRTGRRLSSRIFGSDNEEEIHSVVSDMPGLYARSCSMNTLTDANGGQSSSASCVGQLGGNQGQFGGQRPDASRLERVEAKMKSIQASLSNIHGGSGGSSGTTGGVPAASNSGNAVVELSKEVSLLKREVQSQEEIISQIRQILYREDKGTSLTSPNRPLCSRWSRPTSSLATVLELKLKLMSSERERRLRKLTDKRKRLSRVKSNGNIDDRIIAAELEFSIERDQVDVISISQEIQMLQERCDQERRKKASSLYSCLKTSRTESAGHLQPLVLRSVEMTPPSSLEDITVQPGEAGELIVKMHNNASQRPEAHQHGNSETGSVGGQGVASLQDGDILLELNENSLLGMSIDDWSDLRKLAPPFRLVFARKMIGAAALVGGCDPNLGSLNPDPNPTAAGSSVAQHGGPNREELTGLQQDIALIQTRLEQKLKEGRDISGVLASVTRDRDKLERENTRLNHRIFYLEEQVTDLQASLRQVRDSLSRTLNTEIQETLQRLDTIGIQTLGGGVNNNANGVPANNNNNVEELFAAAGEVLNGRRLKDLPKGQVNGGHQHLMSMSLLDTNGHHHHHHEDQPDLPLPGYHHAQHLHHSQGSGSIEMPALDTVSSSSGIYSGACSEGSNSPDSYHASRLTKKTEPPKKERKRVERSGSRVSNISNLVRLPFARLNQGSNANGHKLQQASDH